MHCLPTDIRLTTVGSYTRCTLTAEERSVESKLPENFQDLEQFVPEWVFHSERERNQFRVQQDLSALQHYYEMVLPRLGDISDALNSYTLSDLSRQHADLLALALMVMEVAPAVEYYNNPDVPNAVDYSRFVIYTTPAKYSVTSID